jgi:hypothetical protein
MTGDLPTTSLATWSDHEAMISQAEVIVFWDRAIEAIDFANLLKQLSYDMMSNMGIPRHMMTIDYVSGLPHAQPSK